jgi:hypothetical protein
VTTAAAAPAASASQPVGCMADSMSCREAATAIDLRA